MRHNEKRIGLEGLVSGLLFALQADGRAERTIGYYKDSLRHFLEYAQSKGWGDDLSAVDVHRLREFLAWTSTRTCEYTIGNGTKRIRKAKPTTAWHYYRALRRLFNWAVEEHYLKSSPLATIHFKPPPEPAIEGYTIDEIKRLLAVCDFDIKSGAQFTGIRNRAMLILFIDTGLRRAEMINIGINDLDLEGRRIRVIGKGNKVGIVPFSAKTAKVLWAYLVQRKQRAKTDRLWVTEEGEVFSKQGLISWFARLKKRAGVNGTGGVHRLRHLAALLYLRKARDPFLLQLFLRHESLEMSRRYTKGLKTEEAIQAHRNGASPVEGLGL